MKEIIGGEKWQRRAVEARKRILLQREMRMFLRTLEDAKVMTRVGCCAQEFRKFKKVCVKENINDMQTV